MGIFPFQKCTLIFYFMGIRTSLIVHLIKVSQLELMAVMTGVQASNVGHSTQHFLILASEGSDYLQAFSSWHDDQYSKIQADKYINSPPGNV